MLACENEFVGQLYAQLQCGRNPRYVLQNVYLVLIICDCIMIVHFKFIFLTLRFITSTNLCIFSFCRTRYLVTAVSAWRRPPVLVANCGEQAIRPSLDPGNARILGGSVAAPHSWPWTCYITAEHPSAGVTGYLRRHAD